MPRPTSSTTLERPDLGSIAHEYMYEASQRGFIAGQVLPVFEVNEPAADYPVLPIEAVMKLPDLKRAPRGTYNRDDWEFETSTFNCEEYGTEEPVDDVESRLYQRYFDAEEVAVLRATDRLLRSYEKRVADAVFNTNNITNTTELGTEWSNIACTPKSDVKTAKQAMRAATGLEPNTLIISKKVLENVLISTEIKSYLQYTNPHMLLNLEAQRRLLAQYLDLDQVLIGNAMYDSADKGQSMSLTEIWDDEYALLCIVSSGGRNLKEPCLGRTFMWTKDSPNIINAEQYREEQCRSNIYRVRHYTDEAFIFTAAGWLLYNVTA